MATTKKETCNLAISEIGNELAQISDFDTDTGKVARQCRLHYQPTLDELLRMHVWGCSRSREDLIATVPSITSSDGDTFSYDSTLNGKGDFRNVADDKSCRWTGSQWEYGTWVASVFVATFTNSSTDSVPPETGWEAVTTGTLSLTNNYDFGWSRAYLLPTDCIRPMYLTNSDNTNRFYKINIDWTVEGRTILTSYDEAFLLYIAEPAIADMDSLFVQAFYTLLASKLATPVAGDRDLKRELLTEFTTLIMPEARRVNSFEGHESPSTDSEWLEATYSSNSLNGFGGTFNENSDGSIKW